MSFQKALIETLSAQAAQLSAEMAAWAKNNHPWEDQSGGLTRSLEPIAETSGSAVRFGIASREIMNVDGKPVDYAPYVEAMPGKGVMEATLERFAPEAKRRMAAAAAAATAEWLRAGGAA